MAGSPHGGSQAGPHSQGLSLPGEGQPGAQGHLCGGSDRPRPSWAVGPCLGPVQWGPWLGSTVLWGAGVQPCCSFIREGDGGPGADMGICATSRVGESQEWVRTGRSVSAIRALTNTVERKAASCALLGYCGIGKR